MKGLYKILVILLIALLCLPGVQQLTHIINVKPLKGVTYNQDEVAFSFSNYLNFDYQLNVLEYIDQNFGFRPFFIRLYNQVQFSVFKVSHGFGVIVGKDDYLFEKWFIEEGLGNYFIAEEEIISNVEKLSVIRKFLNYYDTELLVIIAPGKNYYYPEFIPDYFEKIRDETNYSRYAKYLGESDVPTFDVNQWFMQLKGKEKAPLFPKTGTHWSYYGAEIAADSIIKISEKLLNRELNKSEIIDMGWDENPHDDDIDLEDISNLFFPIKTFPHSYPRLKFDKKHEKETQPSAVVISGSFFWHIFNNSMLTSYQTIWFWYYYNSIFPQSEYKTVKELDVDLQIKNTDIVMMLTSSAGLFKIGYGFIDEAYDLALKDDTLRQETIKTIAEKILTSKDDIQSVTLTAKTKNISFDSALVIEAAERARVKLKKQFYYPKYPLK